MGLKYVKNKTTNKSPLVQSLWLNWFSKGLLQPEVPGPPFPLRRDPCVTLSAGLQATAVTPSLPSPCAFGGTDGPALGHGGVFCLLTPSFVSVFKTPPAYFPFLLFHRPLPPNVRRSRVPPILKQKPERSFRVSSPRLQFTADLTATFSSSSSVCVHRFWKNRLFSVLPCHTSHLFSRPCDWILPSVLG